MYKFNRNSQITFSDFYQPMRMKMNANNISSAMAEKDVSDDDNNSNNFDGRSVALHSILTFHVVLW